MPLPPDDDSKPHLAAWLNGKPVYRGTEGEWRQVWRDAVKKHAKTKQVLTRQTIEGKSKGHEQDR